MPLTAVLAGDLGAFTEMVGTAMAALADRARARPEHTVDVVSGSDAVLRAGPAWRSIERAGGIATPFQSIDFAARAAEAHIRRGETLRIVVVSEGDRPMVAFPTVMRVWHGVRTIQFLGDPLIQYGDVAAHPDATQDHLEQAWRAAADPALGQFIYMRKVRADARIAPLLSRATGIVAEHEAPFVDVSAPSAAHARDARELRRLRRRLSERGDIKFEIVAGEAARDAMDDAIACKREWLRARGLTSSVIGNADWERAIRALGAAPHMRVARLTVGGKTAAVELGLVHAGRWCAYLGALSPAFAKAGPGQVQMAETIAYCRAHRIGIYDLLAPADDYKRRMTQDAVVVRDYAMPLSPAGRFGVLLARLVPFAKQMAVMLRRKPA